MNDIKSCSKCLSCVHYESVCFTNCDKLHCLDTCPIKRCEYYERESFEVLLKCSGCLFFHNCDYCPEHPYSESPKNVENNDLKKE